MDGASESALAGVFAIALEIADLVAPAAESGRDCPTLGAIGQHVAGNLRDLRNRLEAVLTIEGIPPEVSDHLAALGCIVTVADTECVAFGDMALHLAGSDMRTIAQEGWEALAQSRERNRDLRTWVNRQAVAAPITVERFLGEMDRLHANKSRYKAMLSNEIEPVLESDVRTIESLMTANHDDIRRLIANDNLKRLMAECQESLGGIDFGDREQVERVKYSLNKLCAVFSRETGVPIDAVFQMRCGDLAEQVHELSHRLERQTEMPLMRHGAADPRRADNVEQPSLEARALAMLTEHPEWTDTRIAQVLQCNRGSLYRLEKFKAARKLLKGDGIASADRGSKADGRIEAWDSNE